MLKHSLISLPFLVQFSLTTYTLNVQSTPSYYNPTGNNVTPPPFTSPFTFLDVNTISGNIDDLLCPIVEAPEYMNIQAEKTLQSLKIIADTIEYVVYDEASRWMAKSNLFRYLESDTALLYSDALIEDFYDSCFVANIGKLERMILGIADTSNKAKDNYELFADTLAAISSNNDPEERLKAVLSILLENMVDSVTINETQADELRTIAEMCPFSDGPGVYFARAMLLQVDTLPVRYVNDCEFTDTEGSGKRDEEEVNNQESIINLVQNGDFELFSLCPDNGGQIERCINWNTATITSPDYYNSCSNNPNGSVPLNFSGYQDARSGDSYAGIICYYTLIPSPDTREYIQTKLLQPLIAQKKYIVEFYVSLSDSSSYTINNMGAYLSVDSIVSNSPTNLQFTPQVNDTAVISDKENWVLIQGDFIATGNEQYLIIGNFYSDANSEIDTVSGSWGGAYYYIDDVSLVLDTTTGIEEPNSIEVKVYPNPAKNELYLQVLNTKDRVAGTLKLYDAVGNLVIEQHVNSLLTTINLQTVRAGVYLYSLELDNKFREQNRIVIIK